MIRRFLQLYSTKIYHRLLLSYLTLLLSATSIITLLFFVQDLRAGQARQAQRSMESVTAVAEYHNLFSSTVVRTAQTVYFSNQTAGLASSLSPADDALRSIDYMAMLSNLQLAEHQIDSIWVHDSSRQVIYTSKRTRYSADNALFDGLLAQNPSAEWTGVRCVLSQSSYVDMRSETPCLTYIYPLFRSETGIDGAVYINVNIRDLLAQLQTLGSFDELLLLDGETETVLCAGESAVLPDWAAQLLASDQFQLQGSSWTSVRANGRSAFAVAFQRGAYIYAGLADAAQSRAEIGSFAVYAVSILLLTLIISFFLCLLLSQRIYHPLAKLIKDFEAHNAGGAAGADTSLVRASLQNVAEGLPDRYFQDQWLEESIEPFEELIHNTVSPGMMIHLRSFNSYVFILAGIDEPSRDEINAHKLLPLFERLLRSFLKRILPPEESAYTIGFHAGLAAAAISLESAGRFAEMDALMARLQQLFSTVSACSVSFACSALHSGPEEVSLALAQAQTALKWRLREGLGCRVIYRESMDRPSNFTFPQAKLTQLFFILEQENREPLIHTYGALIDSLRESAANPDDLMLVFYQLLGQLIQTMMRQKVRSIAVFTEPESSPYRYLNSFDTMEHMADWLQEKLLLLHRQRPDTSSRGSGYVNAFQQYLGQHYMEQLDPESVAARLGISYSYLRRLLNLQLNTSFSAYLLKLRLQHARTLLTTTQMSLREVAECVGFGSEQTLYRVFRQSEGCTPGEYRKAHLHDGLPRPDEKLSVPSTLDSDKEDNT